MKFTHFSIFQKIQSLGRMQILTFVLTIFPLAIASCGLPQKAGSEVSSSTLCPFAGTELTMIVQPEAGASSVTPKVLDNVKTVLKKRVTELGISGASIQTKGQDRLIVQLPSKTDIALAERVLPTKGQLELRSQKRGTETQLFAFQSSHRELKAMEEHLRQSSDGQAIPKNQEALKNNNEAIAELFESTIPPLTGKYIEDAYAETPQVGSNWYIGIKFAQKGDQLFTNLTKRLAGTGQSIGIFINNELVSSPTVSKDYAQKGITGGQAQISGDFTKQQASDLAVELKSGELPATVKILETRSVNNHNCS
ncbi:MAG: hypothetical protein H0X31_08875 [Nostocaceae cyanobacterium]|nr:hypothetical protein [Nostocaceae cyanobacterium]